MEVRGSNTLFDKNYGNFVCLGWKSTDLNNDQSVRNQPSCPDGRKVTSLVYKVYMNLFIADKKYKQWSSVR